MLHVSNRTMPYRALPMPTGTEQTVPCQTSPNPSSTHSTTPDTALPNHREILKSSLALLSQVLADRTSPDQTTECHANSIADRTTPDPAAPCHTNTRISQPCPKSKFYTLESGYLKPSKRRPEVANTNQSASIRNNFIQQRLGDVLRQVDHQLNCCGPTSFEGWTCTRDRITLNHNASMIFIVPCLGPGRGKRSNRYHASFEQVHGRLARAARVLFEFGRANNRLTQVFAGNAKLTKIIAINVGFHVIRFLGFGTFSRSGFFRNCFVVPTVKQKICNALDRYFTHVRNRVVDDCFSAVGWRHASNFCWCYSSTECFHRNRAFARHDSPDKVSPMPSTHSPTAPLQILPEQPAPQRCSDVAKIAPPTLRSGKVICSSSFRTGLNPLCTTNRRFSSTCQLLFSLTARSIHLGCVYRHGWLWHGETWLAVAMLGLARKGTFNSASVYWVRLFSHSNG